MSEPEPKPAVAKRVGQRRRLQQFLLLTVSCILSLAMLEGALRLAGRATPDPPSYPGEREPVESENIDPLVGWKMPPDIDVQTTHLQRPVTYRTNRQGFRVTRAVDVADDRPRAVFIGDSFTFGTGVEAEETFAALVGHELDARSFNLGVSGFAVDQMWMTLRHYGLPLKPDLVVVSFIWDDLNRSLTAYRRRGARDGMRGAGWWAKPAFRLDNDELVPLTEHNRPNAFVRGVERYSYVWSAFLGAQRRLSRSYPSGYRWRLNAALFREIRDECRRAGVPLVVVHLPQRSWMKVPAFEGLFEELGVPFVDLARDEPPNADDLFLDDDPHFNPDGHRYASQAIIERLADLDWR